MLAGKHFVRTTEDSIELCRFISDLEDFCEERKDSYKDETKDIRRFLDTFFVPKLFKSEQPLNDSLQQHKTE